MWLVTGRYGYTKNFPGSPDGGGIPTKKLAGGNGNGKHPLTELREKILALLSAKKVDEAFDCLMDCPVTYKQKETFLKKFFPEDLL